MEVIDASKETLSSFELKVHHMRFAVKNVESIVNYMMDKWRFQKFVANQNGDVVLKHGEVLFLIQQRLEPDSNVNQDYNKLFDEVYHHKADTVFDVCLECEQIEQVAARCSQANTKVGDVCQVSDSGGSVRFVRMKSEVDILQHTLVDTRNYKGPFLPGFDMCPDQTIEAPFALTIDHIAICLNKDRTEQVIESYKKCFGFQRALINTDDDIDSGFSVKDYNQKGLKLKEVICPSTTKNTTFVSDDEYGKDLTRFVFAESLSDDGSNTKIDHFLINHFGEGVQHIAFGCKTFFETSQAFGEYGVEFVKYPVQYYYDLKESDAINDLGLDVDELKKSNALLEYHGKKDDYVDNQQLKFSEMSLQDQINQIDNSQWYILQAFTKTIFPEQTLFLEIIQRYNTFAGLGAGNISTVWRYFMEGVNSEKKLPAK